VKTDPDMSEYSSPLRLSMRPTILLTSMSRLVTLMPVHKRCWNKYLFQHA
jgi:hypothetical protein